MDPHSPTLNPAPTLFSPHSVPLAAPGGRGSDWSCRGGVRAGIFPSSHSPHGYQILLPHTSWGGLKIEQDAWGGVMNSLSPEACKWELTDCNQGCYWWEVRLIPPNQWGKGRKITSIEVLMCTRLFTCVISRLSTIVLGRRCYNCPRFRDDETEAWRSEGSC